MSSTQKKRVNIQTEQIVTDSIEDQHVVQEKSEFFKSFSRKISEGKNSWEKLDILAKKITAYITLICAAALIIIMLLAFFNVLTTKLFRFSITNSTELITYLLPVMVYPALPAVIVSEKGLLAADILSSKFGTKFQLFCQTLAFLVCIFVFAMLSWRSCVNFVSLAQSKTVNMVSANSFQIWPFAFVMFLGLAIGTLCVIYRYIRYLYRTINKNKLIAQGNTDKGGAES